MINLKINKKALFYPLKLAQGTQAERMQKATTSSLDVFRELRFDFVDREIKAVDVKRELKKVAGKKIGVKVELDTLPQNSKTGVYLTKSGLKGYILYLQNIFYTKKISQSQLPIIMQRINEMFISAFNPKFLTREIAVINKGQNSKATCKFLAEHIVSKNKLSNEHLSRFLEKKPVDEQINLLQMFRYKIMAKLGVAQAEPTLDKHVYKFENSRVVSKNYETKIQELKEKLQVLNNKLAEVIKGERAKMKSL